MDGALSAMSSSANITLHFNHEAQQAAFEELWGPIRSSPDSLLQRLPKFCVPVFQDWCVLLASLVEYAQALARAGSCSTLQP